MISQKPQILCFFCFRLLKIHRSQRFPSQEGEEREKQRKGLLVTKFGFLVFYCRRVADGGIALKAQPWLALVAL